MLKLEMMMKKKRIGKKNVVNNCLDIQFEIILYICIYNKKNTYI